METQVQTGSENSKETHTELKLEVAAAEFLTSQEGVPFVAVSFRPVVMLVGEAQEFLAKLDHKHSVDVQTK